MRPLDVPSPAIPRSLKVTHTAFVVVLVPEYWRKYGAGNFLWFSDVALLTSVPALWLESPHLASTQAVAVLVPETLWLVDYGVGLLAGRTPIGLASYMFDRRLSRFIRGLSLFHVWLTPLLLLIVSRAGYDRRAWKHGTVLTWLLLLASWRFTSPDENVNWVYSHRKQIRSPAARAGFVLVLMCALVQLPVHLLLKRLFGAPAR
jgi:hypothetical protein